MEAAGVETASGDGTLEQGKEQAKEPAREPDTFSREYVAELRNESANYRKRAQEAETKAREAEERAARAAAEAKDQASQRVIMAELRTAAVKAGMVDLDGLKLADLQGVTFNEAGDVEGADALMESMKRAKPYLFRGTVSTSTSSTLATPPKEKPRAKTALEMSGAEWEDKKRELGL